MTVQEVLSGRIFVGLAELPDRWRQDYFKRVRTRALVRQREQRLKYAV